MFVDRKEAGEKLAEAVAEAAPEAPLVLALPRGGLPVAAPVADRLGAPLDLVLVRKIGMPGHSELAAGAIVDGADPVTLFNRDILRSAGLSEADFAEQIEALKAQIEDRRARYLEGRAPEPVKGRTAILVDDGIATGATIRVALKALGDRGAAAVWVAVPVAPDEILPTLREEADRVICLETPRPFWSVGTHFRRFDQVTDDEVVAAMRAAR